MVGILKSSLFRKTFLRLFVLSVVLELLVGVVGGGQELSVLRLGVVSAGIAAFASYAICSIVGEITAGRSQGPTTTHNNNGKMKIKLTPVSPLPRSVTPSPLVRKAHTPTPPRAEVVTGGVQTEGKGKEKLEVTGSPSIGEDPITEEIPEFEDTPVSFSHSPSSPFPPTAIFGVPKFFLGSLHRNLIGQIYGLDDYSSSPRTCKKEIRQ